MTKLKTSRLSRALKLGTSLAKASRHFIDDAKAVAKGSSPQDLSLSGQKLLALKELVEAMGQMKGAVMKLGQMINVSSDIVFPEEVTQIFSKLQKDAPAMERKEINQVFREDFATLPNKFYDQFKYTPIASASIGQVHKAILKNGTPVAVKIQYPNISSAIHNDLKNLQSIKSTLKILMNDLPNIDHMLDELKDNLMNECDYIKEANNQEQYRQNMTLLPHIIVPKIYRDYSSRRILTSEFVEGAHFQDLLLLDQEQRNHYGKILFEMHLYSFFSKKFLHVDPQEGNYLFQDGDVIILDFGATKIFDDSFVQYYALITYSVRVNDINIFHKAATNLMILEKHSSEEMILDYFDLCKKFYSPFLENKILPFPQINPFDEFKKTIKTIKGKRIPHKDLLMLDRANLGLFAKLRKLKCEVNWFEIIEKYQIPIEELAIKNFHNNK